MLAVLTHKKKGRTSLTLLGVFGMRALCLVCDYVDTFSSDTLEQIDVARLLIDKYPEVRCHLEHMYITV